ncbi:MAG: MlaD family protein [Burkholderiales bacterium]|jgi:phospholipid/cholesterol/gamma-HCH transport system substrate-binding protein|nr:MlaD family protein [Burkholderiales bacterium]
MEPEVRYTWIGATLVILVAALVASVVWLKSAGTRATDQIYEIVFVRQSLEGLQVGGSVNMRGIRVGQVMSYSLSREEINRVNVLIRVDRTTPVSDKTVAVVSRNIVTGLARINLVSPNGPSAPLVAQAGETYPIIREGTSTDEKIEEVATRLAESGVAALERVGNFLDADNKQAFTDALVSVRNVASDLDQRLERLDHTLSVIDRNVQTFGRASDDISKSVDRIRGEFGPVAAQAGNTLQEVSVAARTLRQDASNLSRQIETAAGGGSLELRATAQELRVTAELLDRTLGRLRDPRAVLFGPHETQLGPGEKLK